MPKYRLILSSLLSASRRRTNYWLQSINSPPPPPFPRCPQPTATQPDPDTADVPHSKGIYMSSVFRCCRLCSKDLYRTLANRQEAEITGSLQHNWKSLVRTSADPTGQNSVLHLHLYVTLSFVRCQGIAICGSFQTQSHQFYQEAINSR